MSSHPGYSGPGTMAEQLAHLRGKTDASLAPESNPPDVSTVSVPLENFADENSEAQAENSETSEVAEKVATSATSTSTEDTDIYEVSVPYEKCFVCRHLLVGMPSELPAGDKMRKVRSALFKCYEEPTCPARFVRVQYNPFSREIVEAALQEWISGDIAPLAELYKKADGTSDYVRATFHQMVKDMMQQG